MQNLNRDLLADLTRLLQRYGPEDWSNLAQWLSDDERRRELLSIIENTGQLARSYRESRKAQSRPRGHSVSQLLAELERTNADEAVRLREFHGALLSKSLLPTSGELRLFAEQLGVGDLRGIRKREQAISHLIREMAQLPTDSINQAIEAAALGAPRQSGDYDRWAGLILGRDK